MNLKLVALALLSVFFMSCEKDTESFNDAEEAITETSEDGFVSTKADPSMTYYLHGKPITDTDKIENLLKTSMHIEVIDDKWTFYPTKTEQKAQLEAAQAKNSNRGDIKKTLLCMYGRHNNRPFHYITNKNNNHYNTASNYIHHSANWRAHVKIWQKITRGATIMNHNKKNRFIPDFNEVFYVFYSQNNYRGRSVGYGVRAETTKKNINLPWHIGSHREL